jgi:hypothetical protein
VCPSPEGSATAGRYLILVRGWTRSTLLSGVAAFVLVPLLLYVYYLFAVFYACATDSPGCPS